jgi:Rrf2 family transcriptional regulator, iron-sulfur cluster assembly transcription factor
MTVIFSKKCELALQAVLFLSIKEKERVFKAGEISEELKVPKEFVSKMLQILTASGIIGSKKGKSGGFFLAKDPADIKLIDIVLAIDGDGVFSTCVLGFPGCSAETPCPVHSQWGKLREDALKMLAHETLEQLKEKTKDKLSHL